MQNIIQYITEYKGVALHNGKKSIGTPDGITHDYKEGTLELDYDGEYGQAYAFIYNKKKNIVLFSEAGETHHDVFDTYKDTKEGDAAGLDILDNTKQLRYTGPRYAFRGTDPKKEMSDWYEKNKNVLKELCEGRIWYLENIKWELQQYDEDWLEDHEEEVAKLPKLNKNIRAYIAFWNDIPGSKFKEYCDNIVKELNKQKGKDKPIEEYVAIGNNGEPIFMNVNETTKEKIEQRKSSVEKEIDQIWKYHADVSDGGRKRKRELMKGYVKSRGEHFQKERYNKTDSKSAAEFHNKFTKRYNSKTGKMEWGEKIGDSLQMKSLNQYITEFVVNKHISAKNQITIEDINNIIYNNRKLFKFEDNSIYAKDGRAVMLNNIYTVWFIIYVVMYILNKRYHHEEITPEDVEKTINDNKPILQELEKSTSCYSSIEKIMRNLCTVKINKQPMLNRQDDKYTIGYDYFN